MQTTDYKVAGHLFRIIHDEEEMTDLLPSYEPFKTNEGGEPLFTITIDNRVIPGWIGRKLGFFPCNSANFEVYRQGISSYQILISDESNIPCAFLQSGNGMHDITVTTRGSHSMAQFGLNNAVMLAYTYNTAPLGTLLMHSSVVENGGKAYMFLGASGRGKSTHSDLWVKHIPGSTLINDDNPVLRISPDGTPVIYGSPWSGKRPIYKNVSYPVGGLTAIEQRPQNSIRREPVPVAFGILLSSCSTMKFDKAVHMHVCHTITQLLEKLPIHTLSCRPDAEAAQLSHQAMQG